MFPWIFPPLPNPCAPGPFPAPPVLQSFPDPELVIPPNIIREIVNSLSLKSMYDDMEKRLACSPSPVGALLKKLNLRNAISIMEKYTPNALCSDKRD